MAISTITAVVIIFASIFNVTFQRVISDGHTNENVRPIFKTLEDNELQQIIFNDEEQNRQPIENLDKDINILEDVEKYKKELYADVSKSTIKINTNTNSTRSDHTKDIYKNNDSNDKETRKRNENMVEVKLRKLRTNEAQNGLKPASNILVLDNIDAISESDTDIPAVGTEMFKVDSVGVIVSKLDLEASELLSDRSSKQREKRDSDLGESDVEASDLNDGTSKQRQKRDSDLGELDVEATELNDGTSKQRQKRDSDLGESDVEASDLNDGTSKQRQKRDSDLGEFIDCDINQDAEYVNGTLTCVDEFIETNMDFGSLKCASGRKRIPIKGLSFCLVRNETRFRP